MWRLLPFAALLAACAPLPGPPVPPGARAPALVPLGDLLAASDGLSSEAAPGSGLTAAAEALAARAEAIPAPAGGEAARVEALAARAQALRAPVLSGNERRRLDEGPSLQ